MKPKPFNRHLSSFGAVLLFALTIPVVMHYRIFPVSGTSYVVFLLYFILNIANIIYCLFRNSESGRTEVIKTILTGTIVLLVFAGAMGTAIVDRGKNAPGQDYQTHDIILQLEAALRYLGDGKNPYKETYFGTPLEQWHYSENGKDAQNPALYHFVMPPWYLLFSYPFYFVSMRTLGYFDGRMPLLFAVIGVSIVLYLWIRNKNLARILVTLVVFNPASIDYLIEGRSDMMVLWWFVLAMYLIEKKKYVIGVVALACSIMTKQTVWFSIPLVAAYAMHSEKMSIRRSSYYGVICAAVCVLLMAPFLYWDFWAFINSVVLYLSGNSAHSYPISGYGLSMLFMQLGFIKDIHTYYPFTVWQLGLGIPSLVYAIYWLTKHAHSSMVYLLHALTLFIFWYTSRYFNNSHVAYISTLLAIGMIKSWDEELLIYI